MRKYANKAECVEDISRWSEDFAEGTARIYYPKPDPMTYDALPNLPEDVERYVIMEMSGHNHDWRRKWEGWFKEKLHYITQSLSVIGQLVGQTRDWDCKAGVFQFGRKELKAKLQADIDRLQALVNEL